MIALLEEAVTQITKLPLEEQEIFAQWMLDELADEARWSTAFRQSADALDKLADQILADYHAGLTEELDPDTL